MHKLLMQSGVFCVPLLIITIFVPIDGNRLLTLLVLLATIASGISVYAMAKSALYLVQKLEISSTLIHPNSQGIFPVVMKQHTAKTRNAVATSWVMLNPNIISPDGVTVMGGRLLPAVTYEEQKKLDVPVKPLLNALPEIKNVESDALIAKIESLIA